MTESTNSGLSGIIDEISRLCVNPCTLASAVESIVTYNGRVDLEVGLQSLSPIEMILLQTFGTSLLSPVKDLQIEDEGFYVGIWRIGRPFLGLRLSKASIPEEGQHGGMQVHVATDNECVMLGMIPVSSAQIAALALPEPKVDESMAFFAACSSEERQQLIRTVKFGICHIDPVCVYVHERTFTNSVGFNNLLGRNDIAEENLLLDDLAANFDRPLTALECEFLYSFYAVLSGGFRGEEFNGRQLTVATVRAYLDSKIAELASITEQSVEIPESTFEKSALCKKLRVAIRLTHFIYRTVHGITLSKYEGYYPRTYLRLDAESIPEPITEKIKERHGVDVRQGQHIDSYFANVVEQIATCMATTTSSGLNPYEDLLAIITQSTMHELRADVGLTRCVRDLHWLQTAIRDDRAEEICAASMPNAYFCAVFLADKTSEMLANMPGYDEQLIKAIARRMEFNGWHYMPGHFAKPLSSGFRHFYFPPRMTDTAVWSDQRHPGHVRFRVRFSIRSPASLRLADRKLPGMLDMRLMRMHENPFSFDDLLIARQRVAYLRALHQAVANFTFAHDRPLTIDAFTAGRGIRKPSQTSAGVSL